MSEVLDKIIADPPSIKTTILSRMELDEVPLSKIDQVLAAIKKDKKANLSKNAVLLRSVLNERVKQQKALNLKASSEAMGKKRHEANLIPAALFYPNHGGFGVYIKWKGHGGRFGNRVLSASSWHLHMQLPDREVLLAGNFNSGTASYSFNDWDEFIPLSIFHDSTNFSQGVNSKGYMVNAHQNKNSTRTPDTRKTPQLGKKMVVADSGGFQLKNRDTFISPIEVAKFYNDNVDRGVILDFPLLDPSNRDNLMEAAAIQRDNITIMLENINPTVELTNVCHGKEPDEMMEFLDMVHNDQIRSLALPKHKTLVSFIHDLIRVTQMIHEKYPGHYKHIHILGVTESKSTLCILRALHQGLLGDIELTMDSSTALQNATSKSYFTADHIYSTPRNVSIGNDHNLPNSEMRLPCNCPVCKALGWQDMLSVLPSNSVVVFALMYHNIFAMESYFRVLSNLALYNTIEELKIYAEKVVSSNKTMRDEFISGLGFVDKCAESSIEEAYREYKFYIESGSDESAGLIPLISNYVSDVEEEVEERYEAETMETTYLEDVFGMQEDSEYWEIDRERIHLFRSRLEHIASGGKSKKPDTKKKRKRQATGKRKAFDFGEDNFKVIQNAKGTKKASLEKHKARKKPKAVKESVKVDGKTVIKSRKKKSL